MSLKAQKNTSQLMYGIVHGGMYEDLRKSSAAFVDKNFPAISIGGSYTSKQVLHSVLDWSVPFFQEDKPRHLLGIAEIDDLFKAIEKGMDFFDCVAATRRARHGSIYIYPKNKDAKNNSYTLQITNSQFTKDKLSLDPECLCFVCKQFSRAYIRHLFLSRELLAYRLATYHNVYFINNLLNKIKVAIQDGSFGKLKEEWGLV